MCPFNWFCVNALADVCVQADMPWLTCLVSFLVSYHQLDLSELWQPLVDFSQLPETIDVDYHVRFGRLVLYSTNIFMSVL